MGVSRDYKKINEDFYTKDFWGLDRSENKWFAKYVKIEIIRKLIGPIKKGVLYDCGGGVGNYGWFFGRSFNEVIVGDISKTALSKIPERSIKRLNCSVLDNKLPDNYCDCIFLIDVFEHIDPKDIGAMMKDLRRILKPTGRIIIFTSHFGWGIGAITQRIFHPKRRLLGDEAKEGHLNRLRYSEFQKIFKEAGLEIVERYFYSVFFQQLTDGIKDSFARFISSIRGKKDLDKKFGRRGQSTKEELRKKEKKLIYRVPLMLFSLISYLDIYLFGRWFPGNTIFFSLRK